MPNSKPNSSNTQQPTQGKSSSTPTDDFDATPMPKPETEQDDNAKDKKPAHKGGHDTSGRPH